MSNISEQLEALLRLKLGGGISVPDDLVRLQGGFDTDTFAFDIENAPEGIPEELVLRLFRSAGETGRALLESTVQNAAHAYTRVVTSKHGTDLPYAAHDRYAWEQPALFAVVRNIREKSTGVVLGPY